MSFTTRTTCRLCASALLSTVLELPDQPLANELVKEFGSQDTFPLRIVQCGNCGHVQCPIVVDPRRLFSHNYPYSSGTSPVFREHLRSLSVELYDAGHRSVVDIGSNDGTLLGYCRSLGMRAVGVDPAQGLAASASDRGCLTIPTFFTSEVAREIRRLLGGPPDVVTGLNVFAHADNLGEIADAAAELIGDHGAFVFEVAYVVDLVAKNETGSLYHEHSSHHSLGPLLPFFRVRGLEVVRAARTPIQGGSIRVTVRAKGARIDEVAIGAVLTAEQGLDADLRRWPERVEAERLAVSEMIAPYRGNGLTVFGAPARLTPWAYAMGLKGGDVLRVYDDSPHKIGLYTPGLNWGIVASAKLCLDRPPACLIASWNFADNIRARFPDYRGRWLVPPREPAAVAA